MQSGNKKDSELLSEAYDQVYTDLKSHSEDNETRKSGDKDTKKEVTKRYEVRLNTEVPDRDYPETVYPVGHVIHKTKSGILHDQYAVGGDYIDNSMVDMVEITRTVTETERKVNN